MHREQSGILWLLSLVLLLVLRGAGARPQVGGVATAVRAPPPQAPAPQAKHHGHVGDEHEAPDGFDDGKYVPQEVDEEEQNRNAQFNFGFSIEVSSNLLAPI